MDELTKFIKERDEMLKRCDIAELRKFVKANASYYDEGFRKAINNAPDKILEITLHKMIVSVPKLPKRLRDNSIRWLWERGYSLSI